MGFIHRERGEQGPRISEFLLRICNACMEQGIPMVKNEDPGFENYSFNFEAAQFLRELVQIHVAGVFVNKKLRICNAISM